MDNKTQNILLLAIVQAQDMENADNALCEMGIESSQLPSMVVFWGWKNSTLLIPINEDNWTIP